MKLRTGVALDGSESRSIRIVAVFESQCLTMLPFQTGPLPLHLEAENPYRYQQALEGLITVFA